MRRELLLPGGVALTLIVSACAADPVETHRSGNLDVSLLGVHDGCKIYRFEDGGYYRYFVNCGATQSTMDLKKSGKSHRGDEIRTEHTAAQEGEHRDDQTPE